MINLTAYHLNTMPWQFIIPGVKLGFGASLSHHLINNSFTATGAISTRDRLLLFSGFVETRLIAGRGFEPLSLRLWPDAL